MLDMTNDKFKWHRWLSTEIVVFLWFIGFVGYKCGVNHFLIWCLSTVRRVVVQGQGLGPRYGHVMDLVGQRYLVSVSGNDGECTPKP